MSVITFKKICDSCRLERLSGRPCTPSTCLCNCHKVEVKPTIVPMEGEDSDAIIAHGGNA